MRTPHAHIVAAACVAAFITAPAFAQDEPAKPKDPSAAVSQPRPNATATTSAPATAAGQPSEAEMMKQMMELSKPGENHQLLGTLAGSWTNTVKMWMAPGMPPMESTGTAVRKPMMDGRYFTVDYSGKMKMPGPDGKLKDFDFKGASVEAYDNVKKKFLSTWTDNMGTGIMYLEGTYDPGTKTFTYTGDYEPMPGMKTKVRETVRIVDNDHHLFEWYENRGGQEAKTMEINYTRAK